MQTLSAARPQLRLGAGESSSWSFSRRSNSCSRTALIASPSPRRSGSDVSARRTDARSYSCRTRTRTTHSTPPQSQFCPAIHTRTFRNSCALYHYSSPTICSGQRRSVTVPSVWYSRHQLNLASWIVPNRRKLPLFLSTRRLQSTFRLDIRITDPETGMPLKLNPDFGPNSNKFPPLPVIRDPRIAQQVFTHRSVAQRLTHVFEDHPDDPSPDNEKYEHLGDSVLGLVVTNLMFELYPGLRVGPSTKIRSLVVNNNTLADISKRYRLPDRLRLHQAQALTLRASTNIQADVFEAFIGGLFLDQGLPAVQAWLRPLLEPFAREAYRIVRSQHTLPPLPPSQSQLNPTKTPSQAHDDQGMTTWGGSGASVGHLALFNQQLAKMNKKVEWVHSDGNAPAPTPSIPLAAPGASNAGGGALVVAGEPGVTANPALKERKWYADPGVPESHLIKGSHSTPVWYAKVFVDGEFYGRGRGNTKKAARNEAAKEGLIKFGMDV